MQDMGTKRKYLKQKINKVKQGRSVTDKPSTQTFFHEPKEVTNIAFSRESVGLVRRVFLLS